MNILTEGDVWAAEVGAHNRVKGDKKKNGIVRRKKKKKRLLVLSVTPAGSYRSVFKPTGLP